jgi:hypothetical protein
LPALDSLMALHGVQCACYITADNPGSKKSTEEKNTKARQSLISALKRKKLTFFTGQGRPDNGTWPPEESFLVLGMSFRETMALAEKFGQTAIVFIHRGSPAKLVFRNF